ncbi:LCP family protein [Streptomyces afghaniensis]|uniref:LCP family protein n=1 Tax=Streptomyces afghaniensis TaxID=66865 RepID=UPI0027D77F23|nr:LCP family protein [Streptomyces afghaniensis]
MNHYADRVQRITDAFPHVREKERPVKPESAKGALNFLLAGVDSRSDLPTTGRESKTDLWRPGAQRTDTLMLLHLAADRHTAFVVAIPRDSWVPIPGHGRAKINAAFSWGGPPLLINTVERLTGIRIDHFGVIDWHGFRSLTDAVGGWASPSTPIPLTQRGNGSGRPALTR